MFSFGKKDDPELSSELSTSPQKGEDISTDEDSLLGTSKKRLSAKTEEYSKPNYMMMALWFVAGCVFLLMSFTALPFLLLAPAGFNMYFSMASGCFLIAVSFYYGPCVYLGKLCSRANLPISILYIGSTGASLYFSIFAKIGYLYTLGMIGVQALSVIFFIFQAWTSGD